MPRPLLALIGVVFALSIAGCGSSGSSTSSSKASAAAQTACASVAEASSAKEEEACAQGYDGAKAGKSAEQSCGPVGSGAVTDTEDVHDCLVGFSLADAGGTAAAASFSEGAKTTCASVAEASSAKEEEACAQGYDGAKAGKSLEQSCDSVGSGAVTDTEDVHDCLVGFSLADVGGTGAAATPSEGAKMACASAAEGSSAKEEEACAQGYDGAKAGKTVQQSCYSVGSGAVIDSEDVKDCEVGWSLS